MSFSEVEFFKNNNMCQAIISAMRGAYAEMYELTDMWREANEKLIVQEREFGIANSEVNDFKEDSSQLRTIRHQVQRLEWKMDQTKNLLLDWQSSGKMERLRTEQRNVEQEAERQSENLYMERRNDCMNAVRNSLERKVRLEQDNFERNAVRAQQRQKDMIILLRSATLLQNYISDLRARH
ncbi:uncharacterized protein LOC107267521 [Cephus cinctus]|uniref:Uncharacterized protein LOC107267521 n=1 Tax=Cephus cinctus TaxID=211228 RepID=A0AAJ7BUP4_CEPCN|nr:uncharacterized protein LOC107267521 [Cephus cinctus]